MIGRLMVFLLLAQICEAQITKHAIATHGKDLYISVHSLGKLKFDNLKLEANKGQITLLKINSQGELIGFVNVDSNAAPSSQVKIKNSLCYILYRGDSINNSPLSYTLAIYDLDLNFIESKFLEFDKEVEIVCFDVFKEMLVVGFEEGSVKSANKLGIALFNKKSKPSWSRQLAIRELNEIWFESSQIQFLATYYYSFKGDDIELKTSGIDYILAQINPKTGKLISAQQSATGIILHARGTSKGSNPILIGSLLVKAASENKSQFFLTQLNENQEPNWLIKANKSANSEGVGFIKTENGSIISIGNFSDSLILGSSKLYSQGQQDLFIAKTLENGTLKWVMNYGGTLSESALNIASVTNNEFVVAVRLRESQNELSETLLMKMNNEGQTLWMKNIQTRN